MDEDKKPIEPVKTEEPLSPVDEAKAILQDIKKEKAELILENAKKEKLVSDNLLSGSAGGHIEQPQVSEQDKKTADAAEFFKGTQLEKDIKKANKKDE